MMRRLVLVLGLLLSACGSSNSLEGSLSDEVSLDFSTIRIERGDHAVAVSYLLNVSGANGQDIVLKVVADTTGSNLSKGGSLNLVDKLMDGSTRGAITRAVHDDTRRQFPPLVRGSLQFDADPAVGKTVSGSFSVLFDQGGELGGGRTVFGNFAGKVVEAGQ